MKRLLAGLGLLVLTLLAIGGMIDALVNAQALLLVGFGIALVIVLVLLWQTRQRAAKQRIELNAITAMSGAFRANLELRTVLDLAHAQVQTLLGVTDFSAVLSEDGQLQFPLHVRGGKVQAAPTLSKGELALVQQVLTTRQPLLVADREIEPGIYSWLGVPLLSGAHTLGALIVTSGDPRRRFKADDLRLLSDLAATTGIAFENALLYRQQQERASQLSTFNRILTVLSGTLLPETVIDTVISSASAIDGATAVAIYLLWEDGKATIVRSAGFPDSFDAPDPLILAEPKADPLEDQPPIVIADVEHAPAAAPLRERLVSAGKRAWIELLLVFQGVEIGVLAMYYDTPRAFSPETVELLRTFANQSAHAIGSARMFAITDEALERRVGQLLALATIGHRLGASLDVQTICDLVVQYAQETTDASAAGILLVNGSEIDHWSARGYPADAISQELVVSQSGITGQAIRWRRTVRVTDVQTHPDYYPLLPDTRSQLSTPMFWNEAVAGVITVESSSLNAFSDEDSYFVEQLANQAIIAIENARLFRKISEARDRMQVILNTVKEAIILISVTGEVVLANPRVDLIDLEPGALIDQPVDALLDQPDLKLTERLGFRTAGELQRLVKELRAPGGLGSREPKVFAVERGGGEDNELRYVERQVFPVYDEEERPLGVLLVFYDETEEMRLAKTREEVSQMLVHDLRSPLTAVNTSLKLLTSLAGKEGNVQPLIETTADSGRRAIRKLLNRVDSLLDVSRMESGFITVEGKPTELATLVDNVCVELSPMAQELNVVIKSDLRPDLPPLDIDADKIERVLLNLIDNALKFTPADSSVTVRAHEPGAEGAAPGFVRIDVVDAGPGVPDEYKLLLFDRYVQVRGRKGARRGTGLGLTFCRLVTEAHGGRIWIDDNPTGGSIFAFTLPVALDSDLAMGLD